MASKAAMTIDRSWKQRLVETFDGMGTVDFDGEAGVFEGVEWFPPMIMFMSM